MYWIALLPSHEDERCAWGWRALQFTPRVAQVDEALLLEVSASLRLWGGRKRLLRRLLDECETLGRAQWAQGSTSLSALALLRLKLQGKAQPQRMPQDLPLEVLSAAQEHIPVLERIGCRNWGDLRVLPRAGVARRFGAGLLDALDAAFGERSERYPWLQLPEEFDSRVELAATATTAPELMGCAQRLLTQLQVWLQARNLGVIAIELEWTLDLRRLNGVVLPSHERMMVRTGQPTQDIAHLRRLVSEHLSRSSLSAPANHLRLRSVETLPWPGSSRSLIPEENFRGERLHQLVERLGVRLGEGNILVPVELADHRPEKMQRWEPARYSRAVAAASRLALITSAHERLSVKRGSKRQLPRDALYPPWLLSHPLELQVLGDKPHYLGPLRLLAGPQRLETGWWDTGAKGPAVRDYFVARSEEAGLLWVYRERLESLSFRNAEPAPVRWFLHGVYA
jgi:protein ImuB